MRWHALALLAITPLAGADLKPPTVEAFDRFIRQAEQRLDSRAQFLWADESPDRAQKLRQGGPVVQPFGANPVTKVQGGLVHDWVGSAFLPGVTLAQTLALVQDYNRHKEYYKPEVADSRILSRDNNHYKIFLRLVKKQVITVTLATEHDVQYTQVTPKQSHSVSRTTKIAEVDDAGKPSEREQPPGKGQGFLWKLNSYWRFEERDGGTWIECEAISLTRDIPTGLGWIVEPIIRNLPKDSLVNTLNATRAALVK
jgi:hypothetical protein